MKRLLSTTTALSLALAPIQPWPLLAQTLLDDGSVVLEDGTVLCAPTAETACDLEAILNERAAAAAAAEAQRLADEAAAADAAAEAQKQADEAAAAAAAEAQRQADEAAAAAAAEAQKQADEAAAAAAAEAQKQADEAAAAAAADAQRQADEAAAAAAAEAQKQADQAAAAAEAQRQADEAAAAPAAQTDTETAVAAQEEPVDLSVEAEAAFEAAEQAEAEASATAETAAPEAVPVEVPVVSEEALQVVNDLLAAPESGFVSPDAPVAAAVAAETASTSETENSAAEDVTITTVTAEEARSSFEEFAAAPQLVDGGKKKSGLSDLEKVGLIALGALVVGSVLKDGREVVSNSGDRVVVRQPDGGYTVYKDDDTLLRRPGSTVRTESFRDGSTRTTVTREDGTEVVTIRDAAGRVLRRAAYDRRGNETVLIDDLVPETEIDVSVLPRPRDNVIDLSRASTAEDRALRAELARIEAQRIGRSFSLRQIRSVKEVRRLAASVDVDNVTFDSGSAVIRTTEARKLASLGQVMQDILDQDPSELFLVEGHTDAVGSAASNLMLSDRRAESVALALTEYFGIPPENMVVQGYGESDLRIETTADERANRRVAVRVIGPLMQTASR